MTENKEIVRRAYEGMASGDVKAFLGALDQEIEIVEPDCLPYGGVYRGTDEVLAFLQQAAAVVEPGRLAIEDLLAEGDRVVAVLRLGLRDGSEALVSEHWRLRDGKAVELRVFWFDPSRVATPA